MLLPVVTLSLSASPTTAADATTATAWTLTGEQVQGIWSGIDAAGAIVLRQSEKELKLEADDLMQVALGAATSRPAGDASDSTAPQPDASHAATDPGWQIRLKNGSRFTARLIVGGEQGVQLDAGWSEPFTIPLNELAAVRFRGTADPDAEAAFEALCAQPAADRDTLIVLRDGKVNKLRGVLTRLEPGGGAFAWQERDVPIRPEACYGLVLAAGLNQPSPPTTLVHLRDGSRIAGQWLPSEADDLRLSLFDRVTLRWPIAQIASIRLRSDRLAWLNDLPPADYTYTGLGSVSWPYRMNRSTANRDMTVAGQVFSQGIGMHAPSRLRFTLDGKYTQLAASIGIDDAAARMGSVIFKVHGDGRELFRSELIRAGQPAQPLLVPIAGVRELTLEADPAGDLEIGDQANWGMIRLIR